MKNGTGILFFAAFLALHIITAQIKSGPVIGSVTDTSAIIYVSVRTADTVWCDLFSDTSYSFLAGKYFCVPRPQFDTSCKILINNLNAGNYYGYRIYHNSDTINGYFKTFDFNNAYHFRIAFGSCIGLSDTIFELIATYNPDLTVIIGDWGYYDFPINSPNMDTFFTDDWNNLMTVYQKRYRLSFPRLANYMRTHPVAWIWDDHDFVADGSCAYSATYYNTSAIKLDTVPYNPQTKNHARWAYINMFPHYPLIDTTGGIFQEVHLPFATTFLIDFRSNKAHFARAFINNNNTWQFLPPPQHSTLGTSQRNWLFNGILNSNSCWKIIFSPDVFNKKLKDIMNLLLSLQSINGQYALAGMAMAEWWIGYPYDQDTLLYLIQNNGVSGVLVCSGDVHTAAMDDGANAGIPEIVAGGLGQQNSMLLKTIQQLGQNPYNYFNRGGQGVGSNQNDSTYAFGLLDIYGCDSLLATIININNNIVTSMTLLNQSSSVFILHNNYNHNYERIIRIFDITGREVKTNFLQELPPGFYTLQKIDEKTWKPLFFKKFKLPAY